MTHLEIFLVCWGMWAGLALLAFGSWHAISYLHRRAYRKPVQFVAPLAVAKLHLASKWRRDPLRVRR